MGVRSPPKREVQSIKVNAQSDKSHNGIEMNQRLSSSTLLVRIESPKRYWGAIAQASWFSEPWFERYWWECDRPQSETFGTARFCVKVKRPETFFVFSEIWVEWRCWWEREVGRGVVGAIAEQRRLTTQMHRTIQFWSVSTKSSGVPVI